MKISIKPLKIAIVSDAIYPYNIGGKEKRIYEVSKRLAARGHHVTIYTMKWWKGKNTRVVHEGVVHEAISPYYPLYTGERRSMSEAIWFALHCFALLYKQFDVIEVDHMPHLILFPLKLVTLVKRKKLHVTWNEVWGKQYWIQYLGKLGLVAYWIEYLSAHLPNEIISISDHTTKRLKDDLNVKTKIYTLAMGIDYNFINSIKPSKDKTDILFAGRLLENKNVSYVISSIQVLKRTIENIKCTIIGKGPEKKKLLLLTKKLGLTKNIIFKDFLPNQEDLYALMKSSKVFIFPSSREGFGIVALEAIASGLPVITIDHKDNATKELIRNGKNGYIVKLDEVQIANKANKLISSKINFVDKYAKKYDWEILLNETEKIYTL